MRVNFGHINYLLLFLFFVSNCYAQGAFKLSNNVEKQSISFELLNNLIIIPIEVNGRELNFILDSGVGSTILFNLDKEDSSILNNVKKIKLVGLGSEEPIDGILSKGNEFRLNNIIGTQQHLYVISNDSFDLSSKLGITIHGIIGYELLKDLVVKVSYGLRRITFYKNSGKALKRFKKSESFDLEFFKNKPYVNVAIQLNSVSKKNTPVKLLIDSGGSDALWLFEGSHPDITTPKKYFNDFLGEGLSGAVFGKRSYISSLIMGNFEIDRPTVSYPDSTSITFARKFEARNGSLGARILKKFVVIFDYKNKQLLLKKGKFFKTDIGYNMSGMELVYNGKMLVKEKAPVPLNNQGRTGANDRTAVVINFNYSYNFKPSYRVHKLRFGSPAYEAGILEGDILIKINGKYTYDMTLEDIIRELSIKENKRMFVIVERSGKNYNFKFNLKDQLK